MKILLKKQRRRIGLSLLSLSLMIAGNLVAAEESVEERIKKLESMVLELKQLVKEQKNNQVQIAKQAVVKAEPAPPEASKAPKNTYKFGGFIKATASVSDYSDGDLAANSGLRDFYIPGAIPVGGIGESQDFDFSAKETRINFKSAHLLDNGETIKTHLEMDFLLPPGGNERVSNSYAPRLRHAYFTYGKWLFGQTWTTFQDVGALPEVVDFLGTPDGIVFNRQAVIRYTNGPFQIALENPETTITPFGGGGRIVADDNGTPDFVARYNYKADWGHISAAALIRSLAYNNGPSDESTSAVGFSVTGKYKLSNKDDIRFNFATGSGMGRYVALNTANGAVLRENGELEAIDSSLYSVAYRHVWSPQWRSNLIFSGIQVDNDASLTGTGVTEDVNSYQINLLYSPVPKATFGIGILDATRELNSGAEGDMTRLLFTAKYAF